MFDILGGNSVSRKVRRRVKRGCKHGWNGDKGEVQKKSG
jgi:hypothetical protein